MNGRLILIGLLGALLLLLQYRLWIGNDDMPDAWQLQRKVQAATQRNERLQKRNSHLAAEVQDLKQGHDVIESRARRELGMVKPGETFYQIVRPRLPQPATSHQASGTAPPGRR